MGDPIEVDLIPVSGPSADVIVSIASADPDVWVNLAAQANLLAAQQGFTIMTGPLYNTPERTLASVADVQSWSSTQSNVGAKLAKSGGGGMSVGEQVAWGVGLLAAGTLAVLAIRQRLDRWRQGRVDRNRLVSPSFLGRNRAVRKRQDPVPPYRPRSPRECVARCRGKLRPTRGSAPWRMETRAQRPRVSRDPFGTGAPATGLPSRSNVMAVAIPAVPVPLVGYAVTSTCTILAGPTQVTLIVGDRTGLAATALAVLPWT